MKRSRDSMILEERNKSIGEKRLSWAVECSISLIDFLKATKDDERKSHFEIWAQENVVALQLIILAEKNFEQ